MAPELSILLPVRDAAFYLPAALQSLSSQTVGNWVCLALDDGSRDGSSDLLREHTRKDTRFRLWTHDRPAGVALGLQRLLQTATTPWVARMDADDVCRPERLERQLAAARAEPGTALWGCQVEPVEDSSDGWLEYLRWSNSVCTAEELSSHAFTDMPLPHPTWLARREILVAAGGYRDGPFLEDYDLFLRLLRRGERFGKVPKVLLGWRDHPARQTRTSPRAERDAVLRLKARHFSQGLLYGGLSYLPGRPLAIWGAGKTGRILYRELGSHGVRVEAFIDPLKGGSRCAGLPVLAPPPGPPWEHLLLVAVGPRHLRDQLKRRFDGEGRVLARDYLWMF